MMAELAVPHVDQPLSLVPVGLKEAALDSPTFRATAVHFSEQVDVIERWLEAYIKSTSKLAHDVSALEETIKAFLARAVPPANVSEAVLDHDYTLLAMKRHAEGSREWWAQVIGCGKKMEATLVEPIRSFMTGELRNFKDVRRYLEQSQKNFDNALARYLGQSKTKEPSALREDAFQVHGARKLYLKASLDFCLLAPQLRFTVDRLLVRASADQLKEMRKSCEMPAETFSQWGSEIDRLRGWSKEVEAGEGVFRRELQAARKEIAEVAGAASRPSRELEDYNVSTVAFLGSKGPSPVNVSHKYGPERSENQGWLFLRTLTGKPTRTVWVRRWFYIKSGIFGWLVQGTQSGGVEESEKVGVLLCNVKPAVQEDRRFCFEVKTKNSTVLLQAETQSQLMEWLETFEMAKNKALEASTSEDRRSYAGGIDPAFSITPPTFPEFAAKSNEAHAIGGSDESTGPTFDRASTLPVPGLDGGTMASRGSFDVSNQRRSLISREDGESGRDHATRIIQKLDIHRKTNSGILSDSSAGNAASGPMSGIASLISASHNILPVYTPMITQVTPVSPKTATLAPPLNLPQSTLAPSTLANPPAPTNLSKAAVTISGERGLGIGSNDATGGMPSGIMANLWGSSNWGYINRLEWESLSSVPRPPSLRPIGANITSTSDENKKPETSLPPQIAASISTDTDPSPHALSSASLHRKAYSVDADISRAQGYMVPKPEVFPANYPIELRTQDAQFRMLFPNVSRTESLVLVFRATWNPNEQQEFPGRVYVTLKEIYFYSHHLGLVLISSIKLENIEEVTAAPGKDCDFIFLHLGEGANKAGYTRITIKTFLEPLRLLKSRLNFLVESTLSDMTLESAISELIRLETDDPARSPSMESWEDISVRTPADNSTLGQRKERELKAAVVVERSLQLGGTGKEVTKFQLPPHAVVYEPQDVKHKAVERQFEISPKALFHIMFGDKSAVFQLLYHERHAQRISRGPWVQLGEGHMRRDFHFQIDYTDLFRRHRQANVVDHQEVEVLNDHICYVVTEKKTPWHLPYYENFVLVTKIVITHVAKTKCNLAIYTEVEWSKAPAFSKSLVERQALNDLDLAAMDLVDVVSDQVRKLGPHCRTKKAILVFGHVGQQTSVSIFSAGELGLSKRPQIKQRTLTSMVIETTSSFAESVASSLMIWAFAALQTLWSVCSANGIILCLLALSVLTNLFLSGKDTSDWWNERKAVKFMNRVGVGPNLMMSKAVYLRDLDKNFMSPPTEAMGQSGSKCYSTFLGIANVTDMNTPYQYAGVSFTEAATGSTARRLRRTRQRLGSYRHDLLVAMRVVNSVEREMMRAEWENWLVDENLRCKLLQSVLRENRSGTTPPRSVADSDTRIIMDANDKEAKLGAIRRWQEEYCGSCRKEQELLSLGRENPTLM